MTLHICFAETNVRKTLLCRVGHMLNKLMGAHYGDRSFDVFDW